MIELRNKNLSVKFDENPINVIALIEDVITLNDVDKLLDRYADGLNKEMYTSKYMRYIIEVQILDNNLLEYSIVEELITKMVVIRYGLGRFNLS